MHRSLLRKFVAVCGSVLFLGLGTPVWACMCAYVKAPVPVLVKGAYDGANAVLTGKVIGFEYQKGLLYRSGGSRNAQQADADELETMLVRFQIDRWWKMELPKEILLITSSSRPIRQANDLASTGNDVLLPSGAYFSGCSTPFIKDHSYLVYASGSAEYLQDIMCSRSRPLAGAEDDLKVLGKGRRPVGNRRR